MAEFVVCQVEPCTKRSPCTQPFSRIPACLGCRGDGTRLVPVADVKQEGVGQILDITGDGDMVLHQGRRWVDTTPSDRV